MIGCSFVANRLYFGELGLLDPGMDVYGGENIELGIRVSVAKYLHVCTVYYFMYYFYQLLRRCIS